MQGINCCTKRPRDASGSYSRPLATPANIESYFSFRPVRRTPDGRLPLRPDLQLLDILPHPVYLLLSVLERAGSGPVELTATEIGAGGTIHALLRRGATTGVLTVTLEGRPVESYLRVVGSNGSAFSDFVRGTVQRQYRSGGRPVSTSCLRRTS